MFGNLKMKYPLFLLSFVLLGCLNQNDDNKAEHPSKSGITKNFDKVLIGQIGYSTLTESPYGEWYSTTHKNYQPKETQVESLRSLLSDITFRVFMGTWCEDSQMQVPAFIKILETAGYNLSSIKMIAVDRDKIEPKQNLRGFNIEYVPTIIVYKGGEEFGRIVEHPVKTLEEDLVDLIDP